MTSFVDVACSFYFSTRSDPQKKRRTKIARHAAFLFHFLFGQLDLDLSASELAPREPCFFPKLAVCIDLDLKVILKKKTTKVARHAAFIFISSWSLIVWLRPKNLHSSSHELCLVNVDWPHLACLFTLFEHANLLFAGRANGRTRYAGRIHRPSYPKGMHSFSKATWWATSCT